MTLFKPTHQMTMTRSYLWESAVAGMRSDLCAHFSPTHPRHSHTRGSSMAQPGQGWAGSHSPAVAKEGREANFHSVGEVDVFLPGGRLDPRGVAFLGVSGVGLPALIWPRPLLRNHPWLPITCRSKAKPLDEFWL